ncbi:MAG TPA: LysR family transcriptional regulator [Burkholderiales bacterium]|jgi:DNA-binding transcriptional LysR family regulator|nr:LysR family transcriptional regulator [Burkholderiales bacterium]
MSGTPDLNLLPVFEALLRHGNVTRAAADVGLTQSAMSSALGRLRRQLGDPLFINTRSGMLPTPRALELAPSLTDALAMVRRALNGREAFDPRRTARSLRVYMTDVGETVLLPALMRHLHEESPQLRLETAQLPAAELAVRMETGDIDLAVGYLPQLRDKTRRARLFEERYVCMTRPEHPLGRCGALTVKDFLSARHVLISSMGSGHQQLERALAEHGVEQNVALRVPHFVVIPLIVAGTDLIVSLPGHVADVWTRLVKMKVHPLPIAIPSFDVSLYWHPRVENDSANRWLREAMLQLFDDHKRRS